MYLSRRLSLAGGVAVIAATALFVAMPRHPANAADPVVRIDPSEASVLIGETVDVTIVIADASDLYSASAHLTFDPTLLEVVDADPSRDGVQVFPGAFPGPSQGPGDITVNIVDNDAGTIDYDFTLLDPAPAASGSGILARIRFQGKAEGDSTLAIASTNLWDSLHGPITVTAEDGLIQVASSSPADTATPAPTATIATTPSNTSTPTATRTARPTSTPRATSTASPATSTPQPKATKTPRPPMSSPVVPTAAVAAAAAQPTPPSSALPAAGSGELPDQLWRWFYLSGALILGLATWAFTFRFYARQKEHERFWHR